MCRPVHFLPLIAALFLASASLFAQGPLTPSAAPGPTMKTLDQVEPRADVLRLPAGTDSMHAITAPGSYYLSGNLAVTAPIGIEIASSGVTLDLGGFTISRSGSAAASGTAFLITGDEKQNVTIRNGHIAGGVTFDPGASGDQFTGPGFEYGILAAALRAGAIRVSRVDVSGCDQNGIWFFNNLTDERTDTVIEHCIVRNCGNIGIAAGQVHHCIATNCGGYAIFGGELVFYSRGYSVGGGTAPAVGIKARGTVSHSEGTSATSTGIAADAVHYSKGTNFTGPGVGIQATIAVGCTAVGGESITSKYLMP